MLGISIVANCIKSDHKDYIGKTSRFITVVVTNDFPCQCFGYAFVVCTSIPVQHCVVDFTIMGVKINKKRIREVYSSPVRKYLTVPGITSQRFYGSLSVVWL